MLYVFGIMSNMYRCINIFVYIEICSLPCKSTFWELIFGKKCKNFVSKSVKEVIGQ